MDIKNYLIGIILFGLVITGLFNVLNDSKNSYGFEIDDEYDAVYRNITNEMNNVRNTADDITTDDYLAVRAVDAEQTDDFGGSLIKGAFNSLRLIWNSFGNVKNIIQVTSAQLGIPAFIFGSFLSIIIISISFAIIYALLKIR